MALYITITIDAEFSDGPFIVRLLPQSTGAGWSFAKRSNKKNDERALPKGKGQQSYR